ncbi:hypothetical protein FSP39_010409 [Pinctada imbricata]|uniref:Ig-like domain-containing protein n=1 Tax=Pinctada imbricata TaxID=66713 RepID=A0AA88YII1_PINIB|nr:hypothetical protein FSP39_010409 [Pinctada imbricata]
MISTALAIEHQIEHRWTPSKLELDQVPVRNGQQSYSYPSTCGEEIRNCNFIDPETISPYFEDQVFLNFTITANNGLCTYVGQFITCSRYLDSISNCTGYLSREGNVGLLEYVQTNLCSGQGRQDLDEVARCANNKFIQRYYYGKVREIDGRQSALRKCRQWSLSNRHREMSDDDFERGRERESELGEITCAVPPVITLPLRNQIVLKDSKVSLVCKAAGTGPIRFTWLRGGKTLSENRMRFTVRSIPNGSVLRIDPVKSKDQEFACIANNVAGQSVPSEAHLSVLTSLPRDFINGYPRIVVHPPLRVAEKGRDVTLACKAEGGNITIEWYKDYVPLDVNNDERLNILPGGTLHIQRSETSDEGLYECLAENDIGVAYSYGALLYVKGQCIYIYINTYRRNLHI